MGHKTTNKTDLYLNKNMYNAMLRRAKIKASVLWLNIQEKYGISVDYRTIAQAINGNNSWKLLYAWAIAKELDCSIDMLFDLKNVDDFMNNKKRLHRQVVTEDSDKLESGTV